MLQSQRYAAMRIGCYEPVYNFIQILDLLKPNFEKSYGRMRRKWGNSPNIPGRISREWFELQRRNSGCWSTPSILTVIFICLDKGWWNAVTHNLRKFVVGQTVCNFRVPLTINLIFFTENVGEKEPKWRSRNVNFRIMADPLPPPPRSRKVTPFFKINGWDHTF